LAPLPPLDGEGTAEGRGWGGIVERLWDCSQMTRPDYMAIALDEARAAAARGEVPVGAVLVRGNTVIARAGNRTRADSDPTAHAEIVAIRAACRDAGSERLPDADLYVTLEPCAMCAAAISFARIRRLYFAASDAKGGAVVSGGRFFAQSTCHHAPEVYGGIAETEASSLLVDFFRSRRPE
jgi:tRNA(adenine34) deaminase